jgi:hypothetical protein
MTDHEPTHTTEGGGHVVTCSCGYIAWHKVRAVVEGMHEKHKPKGDR